MKPYECDVLIVGSGLGAYGAARACLDAGVRPVVVDIGERAPASARDLERQLARCSPADWTIDQWRKLGLAGRGMFRLRVPKKTLFGSDYFLADAAAMSDGLITYGLPRSHAAGGLSVGWGATYSPPGREDVRDWPVAYEDILASMRSVLKEVPSSEPPDAISSSFPALAPELTPTLEPSAAVLSLVQRLRTAGTGDPRVAAVATQSRLLTQTSGPSGCIRCGICNFGCPYGSIFRADRPLDQWSRDGRIEARFGVRVREVLEGDRHVTVRAVGVGGEDEEFHAQTVFLAAGAVPSTEIIARSLGLAGPLSVRRTTGNLTILGTSSLGDLEWPRVNTQAGVFLEVRATPFLEPWSHVQLSPPNELLLAALGVRADRAGLRSRIGELLAARLVTAMVNLHSDVGPEYVLNVATNQSTAVPPAVRWPEERRHRARQVVGVINRIFKRSGMRRLMAIPSGSAGFKGYHYGASLPMRASPTLPHETDELGRPGSLRRVHVVDSSSFTSVPATTIGLLVMAHAFRIGSRVLRDRD